MLFIMENNIKGYLYEEQIKDYIINKSLIINIIQ
jgi:hypothetical protein